MRTTLDILIAVILLVFLSNPKINFKPFSVNFETPLVSFAVLFMVISVILFQINSERQGFKKGVEKSTETIKSFKTDSTYRK